MDTAREFAAGCQALNLAAEVEEEDGSKWKFLGIWSKNRAKWVIAHWANMHIGVTTVPLFEEITDADFRYIVH